jgi:hypothetical protein
MKTCEGSGCIDPHILVLGTSWSCLVSSTPQLHYLRGKNPLYLLDRRLGGPQNRSGRRGEKKRLVLTGTGTPHPRQSSHSPVAIPTALSRLLNLWSYSLRKLFILMSGALNYAQNHYWTYGQETKHMQRHGYKLVKWLEFRIPHDIKRDKDLHFE